MDEELDRLMQRAALEPPPDFAATVMARIEALPLPDLVPAPSRGERLRAWLQWLALAGGALAGAGQLAAFMFGVWTAINAN